ncbi:MAG: hypothetical protein HYR63_15785 [Proteobacteria bacterium]|nr:hypothetical protein [Pseudomonadota bacterium]MBI3499674.1 hypothetical protein [Pseudomonadota bacterium]
MIASRAEVMAALTGALRLWRSDPSGIEFFDRSQSGFWRSFCAAALAAPAHLMLLLLSSERAELADHLTRILVVEAIAYVISWTAYPLIMVFMADWLGRGPRYFDYMVPYNWAGLLQILLFLVVAALRWVGVLPEPIGAVAALVALVAILHFQWYIAKVGLEVSGGTAAGLVLMDLSLGVLVNGLAASIRG